MSLTARLRGFLTFYKFRDLVQNDVPPLGVADFSRFSPSKCHQDVSKAETKGFAISRKHAGEDKQVEGRGGRGNVLKMYEL